MEDFQGKSGRYYRRNPFSDSKYAYAVYVDRDNISIANGYMGHVAIEEAVADFQSGEEYNIRFTVSTPDGETEVLTTQTGGLISEVGHKSFEEYLLSVYEKYEREAVSIKQERCTTTSLRRSE